MKTRMLKVKDVSITVLEVCNQDYISMTDMVGKFEDGLALIEKWLRNKNTMEFLGIWERINNPAFNSPEFGGIMIQVGLNRFTMSVKK